MDDEDILDFMDEEEPNFRGIPGSSSDPVRMPSKRKREVKKDEDFEFHSPREFLDGYIDGGPTIPPSSAPSTGHTPVLPIASDDEEKTDSDETQEYTDTDETVAYDDLYVDEQHWAHISGEAKAFSNTASFSVPLVDGEQMTDWQWTLAATAKRKVNRARKEATTTDLRQYARQFVEAKKAEYTSWR